MNKNEMTYIEDCRSINSDSDSSECDISSSSSDSASSNSMNSQCYNLDDMMLESNSDNELDQPDHDDNNNKRRAILALDDMFYDDQPEDISDDDGNDGIIPVEKYDDFLTSAQNVDVPLGEEGEDVIPESIPTTDVGEYAFEIEQHEDSDKYATLVNARVIINQLGVCLCCKKNHIKGWKTHQSFIEKLSSSITGQTIPAAYLEGMIFTSIFYKQVPGDGAILGSLPTCLYVEGTTNGFASINEHLQSRITSSSSTTGTSPHYTTFAYDTMVNLAVNHSDTRMILNRAVCIPSSDFGVSITKESDGRLTESIDSRKNVRLLCACQPYHNMHFFLTLTCNQRTHFGISFLKLWVDNGEWKRKLKLSLEITRRVTG